MKFEELTTKKARVAYIKNKIASDPRWTLRALERLYSLQEDDEQAMGATVARNAQGFNAFDAEFLSRLAEEHKQGKRVPINYLQKVLPKYAAQLERFSK